ncbi:MULTISPECIES: hypothetical protein [unclassified Microcystis]|uniref:hypothetical protein n=1 Tax=unclassified Microcystis TaxID=2643300 RepID=UPI0025804732|nr:MULTISPECIES: hypothetical protein [unclassified Microcystis]
MWRFLSIVFNLERTNQLSLLPDKDLVNLCLPIEPYQVTKNHYVFRSHPELYRKTSNRSRFSFKGFGRNRHR